MCRTHISSSDDLKAPVELVRGALTATVLSDASSTSHPIAVQDGSVGLLEVVRALGEYITSTEDDVRRKGKLAKAPRAVRVHMLSCRRGPFDGRGFTNTEGKDKSPS